MEKLYKKIVGNSEPRLDDYLKVGGYLIGGALSMVGYAMKDVRIATAGFSMMAASTGYIYGKRTGREQTKKEFKEIKLEEVVLAEE